MTLAALSLLIAASQNLPQAQNPPEGQTPPVELPVPATFPALPIRLPKMATTTIAGQTYWVTPQGDIGAKVAAPKLWSDLPADSPTSAPTKRIRIFRVREVALFGKNVRDQFVSRRTSLSETDIQDIETAAKMAASLISTTFNEPVGIDIVDEKEPFYFENIPFSSEYTPEEQNLNRWFYQNIVLPKTNTAKFESDDPTDFGPFELSVLVHAGMVEQSEVIFGTQRQTLVYPFYSSPRDGRADLAAAIVAAYAQHQSKLLVAAHTFDGATTLSVPTNLSSLVTESPNFENLTPGKSQGQTSNYVVKAQLSGRTADLLGYPVVLNTPSTSKDQAFGDFKLESSAEGTVVSFDYGNTVGYASLAFPEFNASTPNQLSLTVKSKSQTPLALQLVSAQGNCLATVQLSGSATLSWDGLLVRAMVPFDDQWQTVQAVIPALPEPAAEIRVVPFPAPGQVRGGFFDNNLLILKDLTLTPATANAQTVVSAAPTPLDILTAEFAEVPSDFPANKAGSIKDALASPDVELRTAACEVLTRSKTADPEITALLVAVARSANESAVPVAIQALAHQDTPETSAALKTILEKGPFPLNHLAAWSVLKNLPKDQTWGNAALILGGQPNATLRRIALELHAQINTEPSSYAILTGFQDIEPANRLKVAQTLDPNIEFFARRLIFVGVNDSSEAVRVTALLRLFDSNLDRLRTEAQRGIRDESIAVRLALLQAVADRRNPIDRPVLQLAMVDPNPEVQAAALAAFATQPNAVEPGEVQSAFATESRSVALNLLKLASAKSIAVPGPTVSKFRAWGDPAINALLDKL